MREPRRTSLPPGLQFQVLWEWGEFPDCLWPSLTCLVLGLAQGLSWWYMHLSDKMDSSGKVSGILAGPIMGWHFLLPFIPS